MKNVGGVEPFLSEFTPFYREFLGRVETLKICDPESKAYAMRSEEKIMLPFVNVEEGKYILLEKHEYLPLVSSRGCYQPALALEEKLANKARSLSEQHGQEHRLLFRFINRRGITETETLPLYLLFLNGILFEAGENHNQGIYAEIQYDNSWGCFDPATELNGRIDLRFSPGAMLPSDPEIHDKLALSKYYEGAFHPEGNALIIYDGTQMGHYDDGNGNFYVNEKLAWRFHASNGDDEQGNIYHILGSNIVFREDQPAGQLTAFLEMLQDNPFRR